jgi:hypothetical protein
VQSALETLLRQLVAARSALRDESGGVGEVFHLREHLLRAGGGSGASSSSS